MIWLLVLVVCGLAAIIGLGLVEAQEQITLADLLELVSGERYLESSVLKLEKMNTLLCMLLL